MGLNIIQVQNINACVSKPWVGKGFKGCLAHIEGFSPHFLSTWTGGEGKIDLNYD